jgi:hypothetical protein
VTAAVAPTAQPAAPAAPRASAESPVEPGVRAGPRIAPRADARTPTPISAPVVGARPAAEAPAPAGGAPRRFNPYLSNDPSQKARRLARALVSDLVAYHPQKREEGLRAGTLKELFRDEIRKSWEEYVAQVGAPLAESTPHFQDALNDVLAGGRKVF